MKHLLIVAAVSLVSLNAHAGKEEREYKKNEVVPAVKKAEATFKKACGCALKISLNDSLKSKEEMKLGKYLSDAITDGAPQHCTDGDSKKAMCQLKTLELTKASETVFTFKNGKGVATTDGNSYVTWDMVAREVDK